MFNVLVDSLPYEYNGHAIYPYHDIGIQISQILADDTLSNREKISQSASLLFEDAPDTWQEAEEGIAWFLNGWVTDKHKQRDNEAPVMDWDRDQWRIWAAIKQQYGIDLSEEAVHWWVFMGMLSNLSECSFTSVIDIRQRKITNKMSREEKSAIREAKEIYGLIAKQELTEQELAAVNRFLELNRKSQQEPEKISQREPIV